jgi:hypothetical protein
MIVSELVRVRSFSHRFSAVILASAYRAASRCYAEANACERSNFRYVDYGFVEIDAYRLCDTKGI